MAGTKGDWVDAAQAAFVSGGLAAVRIEALARTMGVTKGSFYWHFANRSALIDAVIIRWEAEHTDAIIRESSAGVDAADRLRRLLHTVSNRRATEHGELRLYLESAPEGVSDAVARVTQRRLSYLADLLVELGIDPDEAQRRSVIALAASLGMQQLAVADPALLKRDNLRPDQLVDSIYALLLT